MSESSRSLSALRRHGSSATSRSGRLDDSSSVASGRQTSRLKKLGASFGRKGKATLLAKSRTLLSKMQEKRSSSSRNMVFKSLLKFRKDQAMPIEDDLSVEAASQASEPGEQRKPKKPRSPSFVRGSAWKRTSSDSSLSSRGSQEARESATRHSSSRDSARRSGKRRSVRRSGRHEGHTHGAGAEETKRCSERRMTTVGLTSDDGLLTRAEALSFSNRYSLTRSRSQTAEEVLGRNSISVKSLVRLARHGDVDKVVALVESDMLSVDASLEDGKTALIAAATHGHTSTVVALYGLNADLEMADAKGNTALIRAASRGHLEVVLTLLSCGAESGKRNSSDETALIAAALQIAGAEDKRKFQELLEIVRTFFERAKPGPKAKYIDECTAADVERVPDAATRVLLEEWSHARVKHKDLHMPTYPTFKGQRNKLIAFFDQSHQRLDVFGWVKVTLLLLFIVYDTYQPHFSNTYTTLAVYIALYLGAYSL